MGISFKVSEIERIPLFIKPNPMNRKLIKDAVDKDVDFLSKIGRNKTSLY